MLEKDFIEKIKTRLEKEKQDLEKELEIFAKKDKILRGDWGTTYPNFHGSNLEEEADEVEEYANLLPIERALEIKLAKVNLALEKIKEKKYGFCEKCHREIGQERLEAIPETKACQKCKH